MAPATKNGGKMVACHKGTIATAKSKDTTVCTESTSGVETAEDQIHLLVAPPVDGAAAPAEREQDRRTILLPPLAGLVAERREVRYQPEVPEHQRHGEVGRDREHVPGEGLRNCGHTPATLGNG
jgi:hypothetical protein